MRVHASKTEYAVSGLQNLSNLVTERADHISILLTKYGEVLIIELFSRVADLRHPDVVRFSPAHLAHVLGTASLKSASNALLRGRLYLVCDRAQLFNRVRVKPLVANVQGATAFHPRFRPPHVVTKASVAQIL